MMVSKMNDELKFSTCMFFPDNTRCLMTHMLLSLEKGF